MLNIEVIKFEAQDVITASGVATKPATPACEHNWVKPLNSDKHVCTKCGAQK